MSSAMMRLRSLARFDLKTVARRLHSRPAESPALVDAAGGRSAAMVWGTLRGDAGATVAPRDAQGHAYTEDKMLTPAEWCGTPADRLTLLCAQVEGGRSGGAAAHRLTLLCAPAEVGRNGGSAADRLTLLCALAEGGRSGGSAADRLTLLCAQAEGFRSD